MVKKFTTNKIVLFIIALFATIAIPHFSSAQCVDDSECVSNQTCVNGTCQEAPEGPVASEDNSEAAASSTEQSASNVTVEKERIKPLWLSGLITFSTIYIATIIGNAALSDPEVRGEAVGYALIPMVGPFISLGNESDDSEIKPEFKGIMVMSGILQIVGVGLFTAGMIIKREPKDKQVSRAPRFGLTPAPMGESGAGAVFTMTHF